MGDYFFLNGEIVSAGEAWLRVTDLALLRGFGIFDFFRTHKGIPFLMDKYIGRFFNSSKYIDLEIPFSPELIKKTVLELLDKNKIIEAGVRMVLTGGYTENGYTPGDPNFFILIERINFPEQELYDGGVKLILYEHQRELSHIKSINYLTPISNRKATQKEKAYDVLYHSNNLVLEVSRSNFFIIKDGVIITPNKNILSGITRASVIGLSKEFYKVEEREITLDEVMKADEAFMTGTTKKVLPVTLINDQIYNQGKPGPVTLRLMKLFHDFENSI